jgi:NADP-reducing hydrogenase subunit HndC
MGQYERHVFVCTHGEYCPFQGSVAIHRLLKTEIASRGLQNTVRINKAGCFSQCGNGPIVIVYPENVWYGGVTEEKARRILVEHLVGGKPVVEYLYQAPGGPNKNVSRMAAITAARGAAACETVEDAS